MPLVMYAQPVKGKRELMCKTDEARVSRIRVPFSKYDGMVERLQAVAPFTPDKDQRFGIFHRRTPVVGFDEPVLEIGSHMLAYHVLKFLALSVGKALNSRNFVNARELRVFRGNEGLYTAMYSDFVSDDNGVIGRRAKAMREYYGSEPKKSAKILKEADRLEHELNPRLSKCAKDVQVFAGVRIPHPESNYHLSGGETVFFEVCGIDIHRAATVASEVGQFQGSQEFLDIQHAMEAVSAIYAIVARMVAKRVCHDVSPPESLPDSVRHINGLKMEDVYGAIYDVTNHRTLCGQYECITDPKFATSHDLADWVKESVDKERATTCAYYPLQFGRIVHSRVVALLEREMP
jgi:hypothetical protein